MPNFATLGICQTKIPKQFLNPFVLLSQGCCAVLYMCYLSASVRNLRHVTDQSSQILFVAYGQNPVKKWPK